MSLSSPSSLPAPPDQALPPGTELEEFIVEKVLGSGGFGITYLARDKRLGRQVVVKENLPAQFCWRDPGSLTVRPRHSQGEDADNFAYSLESFEREASTLASLHHAGIVQVLRSFEARGTAYFVMPFVEGMALDEMLRLRKEEGRPFAEEEARLLLKRLLEALGYLHDRGIYHRDIKPGNILITREGLPVLIDFGAARQRLGEKSLTVIESAGYTPFEQMQSRGQIGPWSDVYALGATFYKLLTGETPLKAADRVMEDPLEPLAGRAGLRERFSASFLASVDKALSPAAKNRHQCCGDWEKELAGENAAHVRETSPGTSTTAQESAVTTKSPPVKPLAKPPRPPARREAKTQRGAMVWVGVPVAVLLALAGAAGWHLQRQEDARALAKTLQAETAEQRIIQDDEVERAFDVLQEAFGEGKEGHTEVEKSAALRTLETASGQAHPVAMYALGVCHLEGWMKAENPAKAVPLFEKAAKAGVIGAMNDLGYCLGNGKGTPKDEDMAREWYGKAADKGNATAMFNLGLLANGKGDHAGAFPYFLKAAEAGVVGAMHFAGSYYSSGQGTAPNPTEAVRWQRQAAEKGHIPANHMLGEHLRRGDGVRQDPVKALECFKKVMNGGFETGRAWDRPEEIMRRKMSLRLPDIKMEGARMSDIVEHLVNESRKADADENDSLAKGVQILTLDTENPIAASLDLDLEAPTLGEVLNILCDLLELEQSLDAPCVLLSLKP